ncbi:hypothetical protein EV360DRAFT_76564 [Lentinula raphanica]|nr:hypothetical protein EV360DRAFT_76564 [Lentinula raphanica]
MAVPLSLWYKEACIAVARAHSNVYLRHCHLPNSRSNCSSCPFSMAVPLSLWYKEACIAVARTSYTALALLFVWVLLNQSTLTVYSGIDSARCRSSSNEDVNCDAFSCIVRRFITRVHLAGRASSDSFSLETGRAEPGKEPRWEVAAGEEPRWELAAGEELRGKAGRL